MNNSISMKLSSVRLPSLAEIQAEKMRRGLQTEREEHEGSLLSFVRRFWHIVEPARRMVDGWVLDAICQHLEAVTYGHIQKLLINVPPGSMKSLLVSVFWPAWEYAIGLSHHRFLMFSYSGHLTARDNRRFLDIVSSGLYQSMFGDRVHLVKTGEQLITTAEKGWKFATSLDGVGTGERGDRVVCDDPNNVRQQDSKDVLEKTNEWVGSAMMNRLNDMNRSAIVIVQQRTNENDVSGFILSKGLEFHHLMIQAEYDPSYHCSTAIGWTDPRSEYGEIFWPERFSRETLAEQKRGMGPYNYAGQYQQTPKSRDGGIFLRDYWQDWLEPVYPRFRFVVGSVDPAMTSKEINDPSGFTKWGVFEDHGRPRIMLISAWQKRLPIIGPKLEQEADEDEHAFKARQRAAWGLVEWLQESCTKAPAADVLLVENKASGYSVGQSIVALNRQAPFGVIMIDPKGLDKVSRAMAVQHLWAEGMVHAPLDKKFAEMVVEQMEIFPKGKNDDLVDSATQVARWLRDNGFVERTEDILAEALTAMTHTAQERPLYNV